MSAGRGGTGWGWWMGVDRWTFSTAFDPFFEGACVDAFQVEGSIKRFHQPLPAGTAITMRRRKEGMNTAVDNLKR
jgi:hypothetical protein